MSHPFHNPYPFGNQSSTQRQNPLDNSGACSVTSRTSLGTVPSRHPFPVSYTPPQCRAITDEDMRRSTEMRIGQPREEMRHQPVDQGPCFPSMQREIISSAARVTSSLVCSPSQRHTDFKSGTSSLDWPSYNQATEDDSSRFFSSSTSLSVLNSGGSGFNASSERERDVQSIPGLGDYDYRLQDKPVAPGDSSFPTYTSQEASDILLRFGLEKEDLEYLFAFPEDQITPGNLPFILRQIRMKKAEKVNSTIDSKPCPEPQPTTSMTGIDRFSSLRGEGTHQDKLSPIIKPSKVIDYGHRNKYTGGFGDEIGRSSDSRANSGGSGSMSLVDSYDGSSRNRETLQKSTTEVKTSALVSSHDQRGPVSSKSSMQTYVPPSSRNPTQRLQTQPSQVSQEIISSFSLPKKDTDLRPLKSKPAPLKESEPDCHLALKTKPSPSLVQRVHPDRPGLVLIGRNDASCTKNQSKRKVQGPKVAEKMKKQKVHPKQMQQELKKQTKQQQQAQNRPGMQMGQSQPTKVVPPGLPQIIPKPVNFVDMPLPPSSKPGFANWKLSKRLPSLAMMQDYASATPKSFPHICSLCVKKFTCMKDWLIHQNTGLHLDNCKFLRKRYPQWDGHLKPKHQSRSRSRSPRRRLGSDGRRPKSGSSDGRREKLGRGSQSPNGPRHTRRSRSPSFSSRDDRLTSFHYRSRSHERRSSPRRRDEKQSVPKRSDERQSPPRRRDDKHLPPSRSHKKPSSEERAVSQQNKLDSSTKRLAKQLLETPALQSLSRQSDLETVAKTLAPVLLAELAKMKSPLSSSASASSSSLNKEKTTKSSQAKPRLQKCEAGSSSKPKSTKSLASPTVRVLRIPRTIFHEDLVAAMKQFGKTEDVVLLRRSRSMFEGRVTFVKEEDAQELIKLKKIIIKGTEVIVIGKQDTVSQKPLLTFTNKQGKGPLKKTAKSSMSTSLSAKSTVAIKKLSAKKSAVGPKNTVKLSNKTAETIKGNATDTQAIVTQVQPPSTVDKRQTYLEKLALAGTVTKQNEKEATAKDTNVTSKSTPSENKPDIETLKTPKIELKGHQSAVVSEDQAKVLEARDGDATASEKKNQAEFVKVYGKEKQDKLTEQLESVNREVAEPIEDESSLQSKEERCSDRKAIMTKSTESQPPDRTVDMSLPNVPAHPPQRPQTAVQTSETLFKASSQMHKSAVLEHNSTARGQTPQETAGSSAEAALEPKEIAERVEHSKPKKGLLETIQATNVPPKSTASEDKPDIEAFKTPKTDTNVKESSVMPEDGAKVPETRNVLASKMAQQAEIAIVDIKTKEAIRTEALESGSIRVMDPTEAECSMDKEVQESGKVPTTKVPETKNISACKTKQQAELVKSSQVGTKEANTKVTEPTKVEHTTDKTPLLTKSNEGQPPTRITGTAPRVSLAKPSPKKSQTSVKKTETIEITEVQESGSVKDDVKEQEAKHAKMLECGKTEVAEPMEVEHLDEKKALLTKSNDCQTPTSTAETTPDISPTTGESESGNTNVAEPVADHNSENGEKLPCRKDLLVKSSERQPSKNTAETTLDASLPKSSTDPLKTPQTTIKKPVSQIQQSMTPDPELTTAQGQIQQQTSGSSAEVTLKAKQKVQSVKTVAQQKDPVIAVTTRKVPPSKTISQTLAVSTEVSASAKTEATAAAKDEQQPVATASSSFAFSSLAIGETIEKLMCKDSLSCLKKSKTQPSKVLSITNLPEYHNSCYTEADVANLLSPFGFQYLDEDIYVIPQMRAAFAYMPSLKQAENLIKASNEKRIILNGSTLCVEAIISPFSMNLLGFYSSLMKLAHYQVTDDGSAIIYVKVISPSEAGDLREALKKIGSVKNCLPLLSKVFIEFESIYDADRLGVWCSLLKRSFGHKVCRIKVPQIDLPSRPPRLAAKAFPDSKDVAEGAIIPTSNFGIPQGSTSPFWVTMKSSPFLFPTASPWFIIPGFLTVTVTGIKTKKTHHGGYMHPHVMLTNLPEGNYRHEDIAKLVWRYFPVQNGHNLNNNIIVLSLQRRAFVFFSNWNACNSFVSDCIKNPVSIGGRVLDVHYVRQYMHPGSSEEIKYRNLMKWSNSHVTELQSLEERLLCVEISETSVDLIMTVMEVVASNAAFVRFLPLANRIYIEMAEPSGVTQVLKNIASVDYLSTHAIWSKVRRIETLKSLKQHLQDSSDNTVNLELDTKPPAVMSGAQPTHSDEGANTLHQASSSGSAQPVVSAGSTISKSLTDGQSAVATSDAGMKETCDKPVTEITKTSTIAHQASQKAEGREATSVPSADGRTGPTACSSAPPVTNLVKSKENIKELPVIKAHEPRLIQGTKKQHVVKKSPSSSNTPRSELNEEQTCRVGGEKQSQVVSPAAKQISPKSSTDSKSSSSSSVSQTAISSSPESIETSSLPSEKAQKDKPESPEIAMCPPSSDSRTCSSKMASTGAVDVAVETHQLHRENAKPTESAVGKSDHKVSTETKTEISLEIQSTAQGQELESTSQTQSQEMDFNNGKLKESTGEEWERDHSDKYPEEEDYEDYQILDSIDDQMDEQLDEHEHRDSTDPAHEPRDSHRVFDSVTGDQAAKEDSQEAAANTNNVLDTSKNQTPRSRGGQRKKQKQSMQRSQKSFMTSRDTHQIPHDEKQTPEDQDHKDVSADADGTEEEAFEVLDSIEANTDEHVPSDTNLFDEQNFNLEDFVTVDEIDDDMEDVAFSHQSSSSSEQNSGSKIEGQSLDVSSSGKQTLNTSCQDSNISASHFSSSKPVDVTVKGSLPSSVSKTSATTSSKSVEARASPGQKTQPSKLNTHKLYKEPKTAESAVAKCAHKVPTKGTAVKTAESESRQSPGPKKGQRLHEWGHQVTDEVKSCPEACSEIGLDASSQGPISVTKDQVATVQEDSHLVEDEDSTEKKMVEENQIQEIENSDKPAVQNAPHKNEVSHTSRNETLTAQREERKIKGKEEMLSEESCKASKDVGQITSDKNQSSDDRDVKDDSSHGTVQEAFEILDSTDDHASSDTRLFESQSLNFEDFVTVDEIVDDVEEVACDNQSTSASKQNPRRKRERQGSDVLSSVKQTSTRSLKYSKSSATFCSFSPSSSKPMKATPASSVEKAPSSKPKSPARAVHTSSSGCRTGSSKVASTAAGTRMETCQSNKEQVKSAKSSVALDSVTEDQTATVQEATQMVQDEGSALKQLSDEHVIQVLDNSDESIAEDAADKSEVLDTSNNQTSRNRGDGMSGKAKEEEMLSNETCKDSGQMTNINDQSNAGTSPVQEAFEILDSADEYTDDQMASDIHAFDELNFNLENFVTVDEIVDDSEDDQNSDVLSSAEQTLLRSSKESAWSPSSSKPTKSTVKNSLSSCVRKTSAISSSQSETPASSGQKGLSDKSNSPARASSSGSRTRSSKLASTAAHEATIETQLCREEANPTKSAVVKSDHKVLSKSITVQNAESELTLTPGAEQDQRLHEGGFQVLDSIKDDGFCSEECSESRLDASLRVLDSDAQDQTTAAQEDKLLVKEESCTVKQLSEEVDNSDKYAIEHADVENKGLDESRNQPGKGDGDGSKVGDIEKFSEESSKPSKDAGQIPTDKDQALEDGDNKATVTDDTEQEAFEVVDSTDHTDDQVASDTDLFDEQNINLESFVTVDEIVDEMGDTAFDHQRSCSSQKTARRKRKSSDMSSCAKHFSTRSSKDSKSQAALSFTSKPTEDLVKSPLPSRLTSVPQKKKKASCEQNKFSTRPFAAPRARKTPLSSSLLSVKTQASPCHKAKLHKTESTARAPHTVSSGCKTHSSKMASTADVEVSVKTQHSPREEEKPTESAAAKSDHRVPAGGITADTKIETSPETHPPAHEEHERKTQSLKSDMGERNGKGNDAEKHIEAEEDDDDETYQIIDSVDDQTEEQLDEEGNDDGSAESKSLEPEQCQRLDDGGYQILGFAEDKYTIQKNKNQDIQGTTTDATEAFEILDSVGDLTEKDLSNQVSKGETEATEEEEEAYEVIDSVEDEPTTTETELDADEKEKRTEKCDEVKGVDRPIRRSGPRTRTSKSEENWKSPMKKNKPTKKQWKGTKKGTMKKYKNIPKDTEEIIQVSFDEDESVQDASIPERSGKRKSVRGNRAATLACRKPSEKPHGAETDNSNPAITARSTSGKRKKTVKVSIKGKTSTRSSAATRDPQEPNLEKTEKNEGKALLNKRPPAKKSHALVKDLTEIEDANELLDPVKDDVKDDQPATSENAGLERPKKFFEKTFLDDTSELVTLDEVGEDEGGDEGVLEGEEWNRELTEDELQDFVTLDEIVEEEEEGNEGWPFSRAVPSSKRETSANVKEAGDDENEEAARQGAERLSRSAKRKLDDKTEEDGNFSRGEEKEAAATRRSGRAAKRTRQNPVRKSVIGKKGGMRHKREDDVEPKALPPASLPASSSLLPDLSRDGTPAIQKTEKAGSRPSVDAASAGEQPEAERPTREGRRRTNVKAVGKRRRELIKPEAKRPRSQSPCVTDDLDPDTSLGEEHMVPKMGVFCNLCSIFYLDEQNAKDLHCKSQEHQENLKKHQQKLQSRPSRTSTRTSQGSVLD